jgi:hypothetical protein
MYVCMHLSCHDSSISVSLSIRGQYSIKGVGLVLTVQNSAQCHIKSLYYEYIFAYIHTYIHTYIQQTYMTSAFLSIHVMVGRSFLSLARLSLVLN